MILFRTWWCFRLLRAVDIVSFFCLYSWFLGTTRCLSVCSFDVLAELSLFNDLYAYEILLPIRLMIFHRQCNKIIMYVMVVGMHGGGGAITFDNGLGVAVLLWLTMTMGNDQAIALVVFLCRCLSISSIVPVKLKPKLPGHQMQFPFPNTSSWRDIYVHMYVLCM